MFKTIVNAFKVKEIRRKILLTFVLLAIYRFGCWLPVPGINFSEFSSEVSGQDFLGLLSALSGGALSNGAFLALGVTPYISASIIIQLLTIAIPSWERLSKEGNEGVKKLSLYTRYAGLILATIQAVAITVSFSSSGAINSNLFGTTGNAFFAYACVVCLLVAGAMFTIWLGERITELGIGNGLSLLIFVGILASAGKAILTSLTSVFGSSGNIDNLWQIIIFLAALILIFGSVVFVDLSERRIPVQYAKQIKGRKMYGGQSTNIPLKISGLGVMPIIFATSIVLFPQLLMSFFWPNSSAYAWYATYMGSSSWVYNVLVAVLIVFFSYFYAQISFNPEDVSRNLQQNGGFIPGIRAGKPTSDYLKKISSRVTLFGAIYLAIVFIVPALIFKSLDSTNTLVSAFSSTGILIVVSVALEFDKQLEAQMLMRNYRGFLK